MNRILKDVLIVLSTLLVAAGLVKFSAAFAQWVDEPAYAAVGLFSGLSLYGVALAHLLRKLFFPYVDLKLVMIEARGNPQGSGMVFLGVSLVLAAFLLLLGNAARADTLPPGAIKYLPMLKVEQQTYWSGVPEPYTMAGQVEIETCVSLKSPRCWSPRAELKTSREQGVGLGQVTRTARFDALAELRASNQEALAGWSWNSSNLYDPRFQLRALVLKNLQNWKALTGVATPLDKWAFVLAAYNGGLGGVLSDRQICRGTKGCDSSKWFGAVEKTSLKSKRVASGYGRSFFEVNRAYPRSILTVRRLHYEKAWA